MMVIDAGTLFATFPLDVQVFVREAATMESRETRRHISPIDMVLVLVRACQSLQRWSERDRGLPPADASFGRGCVHDMPSAVRAIAGPAVEQMAGANATKREIPDAPTETLIDGILGVMADGLPATAEAITMLVSARWDGADVNQNSVGAMLSLLYRGHTLARPTRGWYALPVDDGDTRAA